MGVKILLEILKISIESKFWGKCIGLKNYLELWVEYYIGCTVNCMEHILPFVNKHLIPLYSLKQLSYKNETL